MADGTGPLVYPCSLNVVIASRVQVLLYQRFPPLEITINNDRGTYDPSLAAKIPENEVFVLFRIPREIDMTEFWKGVYDSESVALSMQKEREV